MQKILSNIFGDFSEIGYYITTKPIAFRCPRYSGENKNISEKYKQDMQAEIGVADCIIADQFHSDICVEVTQENKDQAIVADAMFTKERCVALCALASDCVPIIFYIPNIEVVGVIHAGWKGLQNGIIVKVFSKISEKYSVDYSNIQVYIGPHICQECYEVGEEVSEIFQEEYSSCVKVSATQEKKYLLDTGAIALKQLLELGIEDSHIGCSDLCTYEESELFHSYRRKTHTGEENYGNNGFSIWLK